MKRLNLTDEFIDDLAKTEAKRNNEPWRNNFIELKLAFGTLDTEQLNNELIEEFVRVVDESEDYNEAYNKVFNLLNKKYGDIFINETGLDENKPTEYKTKILYNNDYMNESSSISSSEGLKNLVIYGIAVSSALTSICASQHSFHDLMLCTGVLAVSSIGYLGQKLIPLSIYEKDSEKLEFVIKKIVYAFKDKAIDINTLKSYLNAVFNEIDKQYLNEEKKTLVLRK